MNLTGLIKREIKIVIVSIFSFLLTVFGISYGFLTADNTPMSTSVAVGSGSFPLILTDNTTITETDIEPGDSFSKTITVQNRGREDARYSLFWAELLNEIELEISATCTSSVQGNTCSGISTKSIPLHSTEVNYELIKKNILIEAGETHTYVITVSFLDTEDLEEEYDEEKDFYGKINIEEYNPPEYHPLYNVVKTLAQQGTYAGTYTGNDSNDTYGTPGTKTIYYIKTATQDDATQASTILSSSTDIVSGSGIRGINVKFAGYCWQILRTTDTGGIKLIYNGEFTEGTGCLAQTDTEHTHKGVIAGSSVSRSIDGNYMYSDTFTYAYDTTTNVWKFTLVNPELKNWSNSSDKEYILGKYTCKNGNTPSTCETLYYVNTPHGTTANNAYYVTYTIGDTINSRVGTSSFNANINSPAYVGYKFGTAYDFVGDSAPTEGSKMGKNVYWNGSNYVLKDGNNDSEHTYSGSQESDYHYTCNTESATCTGGKVRYYYYGNCYIELTNGDTIETALTRMLTANTYDSAMKKYLENWYYNNIYGTSAEEYIEQGAVYCNDRSIINYGGWSKTGSLATGSANYFKFKSYNTVTSFECTNNTDKFSVSNTSAQLKYPIGLADAPEINLLNNSYIRKTNQNYWLVSPSFFNYSHADGRDVNTSGGISINYVDNSYGVRPVVSLAPSNRPMAGDGSLSNPYVIE